MQLSNLNKTNQIWHDLCKYELRHLKCELLLDDRLIQKSRNIGLIPKFSWMLFLGFGPLLYKKRTLLDKNKLIICKELATKD
jgi:hypothetical protein